MNKDEVLKILNRIMERPAWCTTHCALMVYSYNRIPIVDGLQKNADEGLIRARQA